MPSTRAIRHMPGQIARGPRYIHEAIHDAVEYVPPLSNYIAQLALHEYVDVPTDNLKSIDNLLLSIEQATKHPKATAIEKIGAEATMHALTLQIPFIREIKRSSLIVVHNKSTSKA